ncbi:MAG: 4-hydroxythreonine-4-phosphate dehydrogenase PdxA [Saprospiraceae bacterium]|nr:4-hydroxythreonine-4-phosphate dehydrogenase PdxA [Saprospiraceae bacterium]
MEKIKIGITIGDINGIGLEVILKTLSKPNIANICVPVIYGSSKIVSYHKNIVEIEDFPFQNLRVGEPFSTDRINIVNCWQESVNITLGKMSDIGGKYALRSLEAAVKDLKAGVIDAIVTAPINKKAMQMAGFQFPGHTEYLTRQADTDESLMLMVHESLRIGVVTGHIPLKDVASHITKAAVLSKINMLNETLKIDFGIEKPTIAVLGLNPHAGDEGVLGLEDEQQIRPAIAEAKSRDILAFGPYPADGFFGSNQAKKFDAILAMYHDQGLIPFKYIAFGEGVNYTAGLPFVRTSPDHGTAYDIAGKNEADHNSFTKALFLAIDIARTRSGYFDMRKNALQKRKYLIDGEDTQADGVVVEG